MGQTGFVQTDWALETVCDMLSASGGGGIPPMPPRSHNRPPLREGVQMLPRQFSRHRNRDFPRQNRRFEKSRKKSKKGVDNRGGGWYYIQDIARDTADCKAKNRTFQEPFLIAGGSEPAQRPAETDVESDRKTSKKFLTKELRRGRIDKLSQRQQASRNG